MNTTTMIIGILGWSTALGVAFTLALILFGSELFGLIKSLTDWMQQPRNKQ
jgi:hypothetical protein